jgi:hypothetical protein
MIFEALGAMACQSPWIEREEAPPGVGEESGDSRAGQETGVHRGRSNAHDSELQEPPEQARYPRRVTRQKVSERQREAPALDFDAATFTDDA